ncbi:MAG: hypothetical protein OIN66_09335 [Candidatus Methanoperedens sp.]|nr:hypothetical protein [Candidatus Methanoperedens sp.]
MKLYVKCHAEYFRMLDLKTTEFRQFESIVIENKETGETREFLVKDVRKVYPGSEKTIKNKYPKVDWDPDLPVFAIELGDELDRNDIIVSVPQPAHELDQKPDRKVFEIPEAEKTWHGVGE